MMDELERRKFLKRIDRRSNFCTMFYRISGNEKRSLTHYIRLLPKTMKMLCGNILYLYCEDMEIAEAFAKEAEKWNVEIVVIEIPLEDLPTRQIIEPIITTCKNSSEADHAEAQNHPRDKGTRHYRRDFLGSGENAFRDLLTVWTSKISLARQAAEYEPEAQMAWVDASVAKFNYSRTNWNFRELELPSCKISHYASPMFFGSSPLPINASFLSSSSKMWIKLEDLFLEQLKTSSVDGYIHDEETVLGLIVERYPEMFWVLGKPVRGVRRAPLFINGGMKNIISRYKIVPNK